ncbi:MAG: phosphorylase [Crocinitomicaceae bacterium]|nr:phosphorylase [Crocinitomicaceae bacterium]
MQQEANLYKGSIPPTELIITEEGRIYHLDLLPEDIGENIILVGDQERVPTISKYFDRIELKRSKREFVTHTGLINNKRVSVISTGIGCDNIDIVVNELDALVNIDFEKKVVKKDHQTLNIIRIGTCGALQKEIPVDQFVLSTYGLGFDGLLAFYNPIYEDDEKALQKAFLQQIPWPKDANEPYFVRGSKILSKKIGKGMHHGITATANGFYGPQGRSLRLKTKLPDMNKFLNRFDYKNQKILNFEMETSALYGLSAMLGHHACTVCAVIGNRFSNTFSKDYKKAVENLVTTVLKRI